MGIVSQSTRRFHTGQRIGWPAYVYPTLGDGQGNYWDRALLAAPTLDVLIANPASGPGTSANSDYVTAIGDAVTAGVTVLGYVNTRDTTGETPVLLSQATVLADVDGWLNLYPSIGGIFFDQVSVDVADVGFYQDLYDYSKTVLSGRRLVVLNPGVYTDEAYVTCSDVLMTFENTPANYRSRFSPAWESNYPTRRFWHAVHSIADTVELDEMLNLSRVYRAGYVYFTDDVMPNPYDVVPDDPFWTQAVDGVAGSS